MPFNRFFFVVFSIKIYLRFFSTLRLRSTQKYKRFDVTIENIGEDTAYSVGLEIKLPATLKLNDILMGGVSMIISCFDSNLSSLDFSVLD